VTIHQRNFDSAINSSAVELQSSSTKNMIEYIFSLFNRFINSNETMRLDASFTVYFKVLSMGHVNVPNHRRRRTRVLGSTDESQIFNQGTIDIACGYPKNPVAFVNKCLLTSAVMGHFQNIREKTEGEDKTFELLLNISKNAPQIPRSSKIKKSFKHLNK